MSLCINPKCLQPQNSNTLLFCLNCGSELLLDGRYRATKELGGGGFGKTYEVVDRNSQPRVLKVLIKNYPKYVELFEQEAQVLSMLDHPGIPRVEESGYFVYYPRDSAEPLHCLVMEKVEGLNLEEYIAQRGYRPIKQKRALFWLAELTNILEQVHGQNFFHRDIKPANIMLRSDGCLVLIDFGTVRQVTNTYLKKQAAGRVTGVISTGYTPLEQMRGKSVQQSDFYALGGTMIFLLTAQTPTDFYDPETDTLQWREAAPNTSPQFADLIDHMMAHLPSQRPQTTEEIIQAIYTIDPAIAQECYPPTFTRNSSATEPTQYMPQSRVTRNNSQSRVTRRQNLSQAPPSQSGLDPEFVQLCQQELAEFIGPMAAIICRQTLAQNPGISAREFVDILAGKIPDPQQGRDFQRRIFP